jgi:hypothetical protein
MQYPTRYPTLDLNPYLFRHDEHPPKHHHIPYCYISLLVSSTPGTTEFARGAFCFRKQDANWLLVAAKWLWLEGGATKR